MTLEILDAPTKTFTIKEIWEALQKNGLQHLREEWFSSDYDGEVIGGCAIGQAAYNLGIPASEEHNSQTNLASQLDYFEVPSSSKWHVPGSNGAGSTIVHWNDKRTESEDGEPVLNEDGNISYVLETYAEIVQMAYEVLQPHFEGTIELPHYNY
jgi:hypothetical protein